MLRQAIAVLVSAALATSGCASTAEGRIAPASPPAVQDAGVLADYVQRLPPGSRIRVERTRGRVVRGTLMQAGRDAIIVQKNTRVPEAPVTVPLSDIARVTLDSPSSTGKTVGIGIAAGAGSAMAVLLVLIALLGGD